MLAVDAALLVAKPRVHGHRAASLLTRGVSVVSDTTESGHCCYCMICWSIPGAGGTLIVHPICAPALTLVLCLTFELGDW